MIFFFKIFWKPFINTIIKEDILNPKKKGDNDKLKENDIEIEWDEEDYKP